MTPTTVTLRTPPVAARHRAIRRQLSWPLAAILAIQSALSLTLIGTNTAFSDEALYLWAGRLEWAHWLHGAPLPTFNDYFSGAPQLYPAVGAIANAAGGLAGARLLSLAFMLGATILLYLTGRRLFTPTTGLIAAALWVACEPALKLGAFATYDPMAVFLICLAAWIAVHAAQSRWHGELVALTAVVLAIGSITAYSYTIYIPAVVALALLAWTPEFGRRQAIISAAWLTGATGFLLFVIPTALHLWAGIQITVLNRTHGTNTINSIFEVSWSYIGLTIGLSLAAVFLAVIRRENKQTIALLAVLCGASLLVPLQQARINTLTNIDKHLACGAWFAAIAGAWAIGTIVHVSWENRRILAGTACAAALAIPAVSGWSQAKSNFNSWPAATSLAAAVKTVTPATGPILAQDAPVAEYYSGPLATRWQRWTNLTANNVIARKATAAELAIPNLVTKHYYSEVILTFSYQAGSLPILEALPPHNQQSDQDFLRALVKNFPIVAATLHALEGNPAYRIAAAGPYSTPYAPGAYVIWKLRSATGCHPQLQPPPCPKLGTT